MSSKHFRPRPTRVSVWKIAFGLYLILSVTAIAVAVSTLEAYLRVSEAALPVHVMEEYITTLDRDYYAEMIKVPVQMLTISEYESQETVLNVLMNRLPKEPKFTFTQDYSQSTEIAPAYRIQCEGDDIALVTLRKAAETRYHQPVWEIAQAVSIAQANITPDYRVSATVPNGTVIEVNGKKLPQSAVSFEERDLVLEDAALAYTAEPTALLYELTGLYDVPEVKATDLLGDALTPSFAPEGDETDRVYVFPRIQRAEPPKDVKKRVEALTEACMDYLTEDASPEILSTLDQYLISGSSAFQFLHYTLSSGTNRQELLTGVKASDAQILRTEMYTENCCECDVLLGRRVFRWDLVKANGEWSAFHLELTEQTES